MKYIFTLCIICLFTQKSDCAVSMPKLFGNHMVLQRGVDIPVWGWAEPGERIMVSLNGQSLKTKADKKGDWRVNLSKMQSGGPYMLKIDGTNSLSFENVMIGDVWVCAGQSNMAYSLEMIGFQEKDTSGVNNKNIRLFSVGVDLDFVPKEDVKSGKWSTVNSETIKGFSAVGYFFGQYLEKNVGVPIGLISDNLGATSIETWMSTGALNSFDQFKPIVQQQLKHGKSFNQIEIELKKYRQTWDKEHYLKGPGIEGDWQNPGYDDSNWQSMVAPFLWEFDKLPGHDGAVWFRKKFDLPEGFENDTFNIALNQIDDYDIAWVNGVKIGETFGNRNWRNYFFPSSILKPKDNVLAVRVFDTGGVGGMYSAAFWGNPILNGEWKFKKGLGIDSQDFPKPLTVNASFFSHPTVLYNGNIAPITKFPIKGAIWYQGESNVDRAKEYKDLLPAMVRDWRTAWGIGDFPFLVVQLANYKQEPKEPKDSEWAELREAQAQIVQLKNTAIVTAIDIGEANDIHPKNKQDVGGRLGRAALKIAYNRNIECCGPTYNSHRFEGNKAIINFDHAENGVFTKNKYGYISGFAISGEDRKFHWAMAKIEENKVVVWCDKIANPKHIRYAWADNPGKLDLYNMEGLPAMPFRTDDWPGATSGKVYQFDEHGF